MTFDGSTAFIGRLSRWCREQADELRDVLEQAYDATAAPHSPATLDHRRVLTWPRNQDRHQLWSRAGVGVMHMAVSVADHLRTLGLALEQPDAAPIYTHATIARAAVESAGFQAYLLDASVTPKERFARAMARLLEDGDAARRAAMRVPAMPAMPAPGPAMTAEYQKLCDDMARAMIEIVEGKRGPKAVVVEPGTEPMPILVQASTVVETAFARLPAVYALLSGTTHAMPWRLADNAQISARYGVWAPDPIDLAASVVAALAAGLLTAEVHSGYRSVDTGARLFELRRRYKAADDALRRFGLRRLGTPHGIPLRARRFDGGQR